MGASYALNLGFGIQDLDLAGWCCGTGGRCCVCVCVCVFVCVFLCQVVWWRGNEKELVGTRQGPKHYSRGPVWDLKDK